MDEFDVLIKNADILWAQHIIFREKKIPRLLEKKIVKVVTSEDILSNTQIFNPRFINKIKYLGTNKTYKKIWLIIQAFNNQEKDLILTWPSTI